MSSVSFCDIWLQNLGAMNSKLINKRTSAEIQEIERKRWDGWKKEGLFLKDCSHKELGKKTQKFHMILKSIRLFKKGV